MTAPAVARPVVLTFRRHAFYGEHSGTEPKWHIAEAEPSDRWGTWIGRCGYAYSNILGGVRVSRSKTPKKSSETCGKCLAAIAKAGKQAAKEQAATERKAARAAKLEARS